MSKIKDKKITYADAVSNKIIEALEAGVAPWQKPWSGAQLYQTYPFNAKSLKSYSGINNVNLMIEAQINGYGDPRWLTYKQAAELGASVNKGEKGTTVQYWKYKEEKDVVDENGKVIGKETIKLENPKVFYSTVFNAQQTTLPPLEQEQLPQIDFNPNEMAEKILKNSGADIRESGSDRAYYMPTHDYIQLPLREQFNSAAEFYSTALHELGHWTGHKTRLDRDLSGGFGSESYAKEELRAEISSFMMSQRLGIDFDPSNHYSYIDSWIKALREDNKEIFKASRDAEKITDYIEGLSMEKTKEIEQSKKAPEVQYTQFIEIEKNNKNLFFAVQYELNQNNEPQILGGYIRSLDKNDFDKSDLETKKLFKKEGDFINLKSSFFDENKDYIIETISNYVPAVQKNLRLQEQSLDKQTYLYVPKEEKEAAKSVGCRWDAENQAWYAPKGTELLKVSSWMLDNQQLKNGIAGHITSGSDPMISFKAELEKRGFELKGEPIANGKIQSVHIQGHTTGSRNGRYAIHQDGVPTLWLKDWKTGIEETIVHKDSKLNSHINDKSLETQKEINRIRNIQSDYDKNRMHYAVAKRLEAEIPNLSPATADNFYLAKKGIEPTDGVKVDGHGNLVIPFSDKDGNIKTVQKILKQDDGTYLKLFEKGGEKTGNYHTIYGDKKDVLIVCEGYATGATLNQATGYSVQVAGDSGNLKAVVENLVEINKNAEYPKNINIIIAADNDVLVTKPIKNPGLTKAKEAAAYIAETYPDLKDKIVIAVPILTGEEIKNKATDFNDIHKSRGLKAVETQINVAVQKLVQTQVVKSQNKQMQKTTEAVKEKFVPKQQTKTSSPSIELAR